MITAKKLDYLENQASTSEDFAELATFLEIEKNYPEVENTIDRERIRTYAKERIQQLAKLNTI
jgi:hypothetical protein